MRFAQLWSGQVRVAAWAWLASLGACLMLAPLFDSLSFLTNGAFGAALVAAAGLGMRALRAPLLLTVLAQLAVAIEWALLRFTDSMAYLIVPTPTAVGDLVDHVRTFDAEIERYAPPMPDDPSVTATMAMVVVGIALVVDLVTLGWRQVPMLGLLFLGIYMAPVALLSGSVAPAAFVPGALGFVFLLAAEHRERVVRWGRQVADVHRGDEPTSVDVSRLVTSGRQVGFTAIVLAVFLPVLIPTFSPQFFGTGGTGGGGGDGSSQNGDAPISVQDPVLDLRRNLTQQSNDVLVTFRTSDPGPELLRLTALDEFTGNEWRPGERPDDISIDVDNRLPSPPGLSSTVARQTYVYEMSLTDAWSTSWLPVRYAPTTVDVEGEWQLDPANFDIVSADGESASQAVYTFQTQVPDPDASELRAAGVSPRDVARFTDLPEGLPAIIGQIARGVTANEETAYDKAFALQTWFRSTGGFQYDLSVAAGSGLQTITDFVTTDKRGYCEQFAAAMALMSRELDIPARVAVGFLRPTRNDDGSWSYRANDMHAWPELYFQGSGWVRFEPTPGSRSGDAPTFDDQGQGATPTGPTDTPSLSAPTDLPRDAGADDQAGGGGIGSLPWGTIALVMLGLFVLAALVFGPRGLRASTSARRWGQASTPPEVAAAAWAELRASVLDLSLTWREHATPRETGRALGRRIAGSEEAEEALRQVVRFVEQARYSRQPAASDDVRNHVTTVTTTLARRASDRARWRATWLPRSLVVGRGVRPRARGGAAVPIAE